MSSATRRLPSRPCQALTEIVRRYPESPYAADARLKIDLVNDHLAGKEMEIGRFLPAHRPVAGGADCGSRT